MKDSSELRNQLRRLADDPEIRVRFQTACSLGALRDEQTVAALARIMKRDSADRWVRTAVLASVPQTAGSLLNQLLADPAFVRNDNGFLGQLALIIGTRNDPEEVRATLRLLADPAWQSRAGLEVTFLREFATGLARSGSAIGRLTPTAGPQAKDTIRSVFQRAEETALDKRENVHWREEAIQLLGFAGPEVRERLTSLLAASEIPAIQEAVIRALSSQTGPNVARVILSQCRSYSPSVRREAIEALFRRPERLSVLLQEIEDGTINSAELDAARRAALLAHTDPGIRRRALKIFGEITDRRKVIEQYRAAIIKFLPGNPRRGAEVFERNCAVCHRHSPRENVGPRLGGLPDRSPEVLLVSILDPNREVKPAFVNFTLTTTDGQELSGIIANETESSVTLRRPGGEEDNVLRKNIQSLRSSSVSLMPEGLENGIDPQPMADLIQFLEAYRD